MRIPIHRLLFRPILSQRGLDCPRGYYGLCATRSRVIMIDPRQSNPARTLLHELLHLSHPSWSERAVASEEAQRWRRMTWKDKARLLQALGRGRLD